MPGTGMQKRILQPAFYFFHSEYCISDIILGSKSILYFMDSYVFNILLTNKWCIYRITYFLEHFRLLPIFAIYLQPWLHPHTYIFVQLCRIIV